MRLVRRDDDGRYEYLGSNTSNILIAKCELDFLSIPEAHDIGIQMRFGCVAVFLRVQDIERDHRCENRYQSSLILLA